MWTLVVIVAISILVVLAVVAALMWKKVYRLERERKAKLAEQEALATVKIAEHRGKLNKNIRVVVGALLKEELTYTEAALRICYALEQLGVDGQSHPEFAAFFELRAKTSHIPILAAWRALDASTQKAFDKERLAAEIELGDAIAVAATQLQSREF